jgi:hypothetical protein
MEAIQGKTKHYFTPENQPEKRGRPKNIFGPLAKANDLTNDDVKKIFKNLLTSKPEELNQVIEKYPTVLTIATANILAQEMKGELTGRMEMTGRKIQKSDKEGNPVFDSKKKPVMIDEVKPERKRSYDMVKYMIDRCFGRPIQTDLIIGAGISEESEKRILQIFSETFEESGQIKPALISEQLYLAGKDDSDE